MNAELNLELGLALLQQYRNVHEVKHTDVKVLKDACKYAKVAAAAAGETMSLSIKENEGIGGGGMENSYVGVLSHAPELYQRATALSYDIECIIHAKEKVNKIEENVEFCGNDGPSVIEDSAVIRKAYRQYQRGLHFFPTLENHELMIQNLVKVIL
jgi:hypothetical protein